MPETYKQAPQSGVMIARRAIDLRRTSSAKEDIFLKDVFCSIFIKISRARKGHPLG